MGDVGRLGAYVIPGPAMDANAAVVETVAAERLGLGSVWESEIQSPVKDAGAILGCMGYATDRIRLGTSITHFSLRHPLVLASWGATMQMLTGNRFEFGFGRSSPSLFARTGTTMPTLTAMEDWATILRTLWSGETLSYDGPAGKFNNLGIGSLPEGVTPPPLLLAAVGPRTLELVGRVFDGVFLHPFLTPEAVHRSQAIIRKAAQEAGRDPSDVRIYHELVTAPDMDEDEIDAVVGARLGSYLMIPGVENMIPEANGWDVALLEPFRKAVVDAFAENEAAGSPLKGREILVKPARLIPREWKTTTAAIGTPSECAAFFDRYFDVGADEIILHGVTADRLGPTVDAFARM
jgi:5,10-methylenetetrahydromethanopterin reductase